MKEQDNTSGRELKEIEGSKLPDKEFRVIIMKMLTKFRKRMDEHSENFNKVKKCKQVPNRSE